MPIYEYQCSSCGHEFDELQKIADDPLVDCPACDNPDLVKLVSAPSFRLKGSGWYETDFKKDKRKNLADDGSKSDEASSSDKSTQQKGESSSESTTKKTKEKASKPKPAGSADSAS